MVVVVGDFPTVKMTIDGTTMRRLTAILPQYTPLSLALALMKGERIKCSFKGASATVFLGN